MGLIAVFGRLELALAAPLFEVICAHSSAAFRGPI
jgi:hypothetical protein